MGVLSGGEALEPVEMHYISRKSLPLRLLAMCFLTVTHADLDASSVLLPLNISWCIPTIRHVRYSAT